MTRKDITSQNTIADSVRPIVAEVSEKLDVRMYKRAFLDYQTKAVEAINDPEVTASDRQRKRWTNAVNGSTSMEELLFTLCNIDLGASNNRMDRGTSKKSAEFGHWV